MASQQDTPISVTVSVLMIAALYLPAIWRRRYPLGILLVALAIFVPYRLLEVPEVRFSGNFMLFVLAPGAAFSDNWWRAPVIAVFLAVIVGMFVRALIQIDLSQYPGNIVLLQILSALGSIFYFGFALWFGLTLRSRRLRQVELVDRTVQLEQQREENARRAVLDERVRIARELHDVVAHHVSVMGLQAGAARRVLASQPEKATEALAQIETSSRQAVVELQQLLGFLRHQDQLVPQPTLAQLNTLVIEAFVSLPAGVTRASELEQLTEREVDVLKLLMRGQSNDEIAQSLTITPGTTKTHVSNLLGKLGLRDRTQAVVFACESGLVKAGTA